MRSIDLLVRALRESMRVAAVDDHTVVIGRSDAPEQTSTLIVFESELTDYLRRTAADALVALGVVADDPTGIAAAIGLLSVHIEEEVYADSGDRLESIRVRTDRLEIARSAGPHSKTSSTR